MNEQRPLHRLFGLSWIDFFDGTSVEVKTELDLSLKQQFVDVVLIRTGPEPIARLLPDGFEDLTRHNLVTFKSHQEALDGWALAELIGHYVNYRKQSSKTMQELAPDAEYKLFAVCARYPQGLVQKVALTDIREGVYEVRALDLCIRVIVVSQLPQVDQNAMLHLFSAREELLRFGRDHYRPHSRETSTLLRQLLQTFREDIDMDQRLKDFVRETTEKMLAGMTPEERLKGLSPEERLKGLSPEEVVQALPPEALEVLARKLKANGSPTK